MVKFSALMSVYKNECPEFLDLAIKSTLVSQSIKPSEFVIVKDGPLTKDIELILKKYNNQFSNIIKFVAFDENQGLGKALQKGLEHCSNEIVFRMDSDDINLNDRFEKQLRILNPQSNIDVISSWVTEFNKSTNDLKRIKKVPETHNSIKIYFKKRNALNHMAVGFKKSKVLQVGNYMDMPFFEDYFLWVRMILSGMKFYNIQESLVYARVGNNMIGRRHGLKYAKYEFKFFSKLYKLKFLTTFQYIKVCVLRIILRFLPKNILSLFYKNIIRK